MSLRNDDCSEKCPRFEVAVNSPCLWGEGPKNAKILIVGRDPGQTEDLQGRPFVGESGKLLNNTLENVGISRDEVYITNAVKCTMPGYNKPPSKKILRFCRIHLEKEIKEIKPNLIVTLGSEALESVLGKTGITKWKNNVYFSEEFGIKVIPIYHPAYVLRYPEQKKIAIDFKKGFELVAAEYGSKSSNRSECKFVIAQDKAKIDKILNILESSKEFAFDLETSSLNPILAKIGIISVSWKKGYGAAIVWDKLNSNQKKRLYKLLTSKHHLKIGHNLKYDIEVLLANKVKVKGPFFDTIVAHSLLDESAQHNLDYCVLTYLDMGDYWKTLDEYKAAMDKSDGDINYLDIPMEILGEYAAKDAIATYRLYKIFKKRLAKQDLLDYFNTFSMSTMLVLIEMELRGIKIDRKRLKALIKAYRRKIDKLSLEITNNKYVKKLERHTQKDERAKLEKKYKNSKILQNRYNDIEEYVNKNLKSCSFNPRSTPQMKKLFFDKSYLKLKPVKKTKTGAPSLDKQALEIYANKGIDLAKAIISHRQAAAYLSNFLTVVYEKSKIDGRIHTSFLQHSTVTGRLACVSADTFVETINGPKRIDEIEIGDLVLTHMSRYKPVIAKINKGIDVMYRVQAGDQHIKCTTEHIFFTPDGWLKLSGINIGNKVYTYSGINGLVVHCVVKIEKINRMDVWDISVADDHSYVANGFVNHNSQSPNLQNIPRDANDYKECFIADKGYIFLKADLAQAEFRCWAHYSKDKRLIDDIKAGLDIHRLTASEVFGIPPEKVTSKERTPAKRGTFGMMFGVSPQHIAEEFNIPLTKAKAINKTIYAKYPKAVKWLKEQIRIAKRDGQLRSWLGRIRRLPNINSDNQALRGEAERQALNCRIQMLACAMNDHYMKRTISLARKHKIDCFPCLTIHDAGVFQVKKSQYKDLIRIMNEVVKTSFPDFRCPMQFDYEVGKTLANMEEIDAENL